MPKQYVPIGEAVLQSDSASLPALTYWDGDMGLTDSVLVVAGSGDNEQCYRLGGLYLCRAEEQPDPEVTAIERIATALERIANVLEASSALSANAGAPRLPFDDIFS